MTSILKRVGIALALAAWGLATTPAGAAAQTFTDVTSAAGFFGLNSSWASAWTDYDGDGHVDVMTLGHVQDITPSISQLWRNNGDGTFTDVTTLAGMNPTNGDAHGAIWFDADGDGRPDLYVVKGTLKTDPRHDNDLFRNNGDGTFTNIAATAGVIGTGHRGRGAAAVDYDRDGRIDLYVPAFTRNAADGGSQLFRNNGDLTFTDVAAAAGVDRDGNENRTASWADYDGDGLMDLFATAPCGLHRNNGDGTFTEVTATAGIAASNDCMNAAWGDYDGDGRPDVYVSMAKGLPSVLYRNNGDGTFTDVTAASGAVNTTFTFSATWGDYDNDGDLDLYIVNSQNLTTPNRLYRNNGDGTFTDVTVDAGVGGQVAGGGVDATFVDYDGDGFLDLFVTNGAGNKTGPYLLYRNDGNANGWLKVELRGRQSNRDGVGVKLSLTAGGQTQFREHTGMHYMSQNRVPEHFGLGSAAVVDSLTVTWPSGFTETLTNIPRNQTITVVEGPVTFADVSVAAGFTGLSSSWAAAWADYDGDGYLDVMTLGHAQNRTGSISQLWRSNGDGTFSDVTVAAGLNPNNIDPHGVAWADLSGDGRPDLYIAKERSQTSPFSEFWVNNGDGTFSDRAGLSGVTGKGHRGRGAYVVDYDNDRHLDIFMASFFLNSNDLGNALYQNNGRLKFTEVAVTAGLARVGLANRTAAWGDVDGDGRLDVFLTAPCGLYLNQADGTFLDITAASGIVASTACMNGAWGDYDGDGDLDLYVTMSSGPGTLYRNNGDGTFTDVTTASGAVNTGFAQGITWGDYDNDGHLDLYVVNVANATTPNRLFRNNGDGTFTEVTAEAGVGAQVAGGGVDATFVDYDNDGFLDLFVTNGNGFKVGPYVLLRNNGNGNRWLKVVLSGRQSNRDGLGARISLVANGSVQYRQHTGQHYMAQDRMPVHFGLGTATVIDSITIQWPSGLTQILTNITPNQTITVVEGGQ